jgi:hypothetical protein
MVFLATRTMCETACGLRPQGGLALKVHVSVCRVFWSRVIRWYTYGTNYAV